MRHVHRLLLLIACLLPPVQAPTAEPAYDCGKAEAAAEKLICEDAELARLDREMQRLFGLAAGAGLPESALKDLRAHQRGWIKGRNECWKAADLRHCILGAYALRVHALRRDYPAARSRDDEGISFGPDQLTCDGFAAPIAVTFVNAGTALALLAWANETLLVSDVPSASGARYEGP
jgi:uncharacterized protein